ncbi:SCO1860 family LAETG-anchored protein [Streptomyces sp. NPDC059176]|uniref:SCO1860 family LAETG-anchored protein n=1 Tax=Streptomyces sp. NPDC059176 TaxID=3346758 RepID=UPI0036C10A4D
MNSNTLRLPAHRSAAVVAVAALAAGPLVLAEPAGATGSGGRAGAVVLRTGLDVSLLNRSGTVPMRASLDEVQAPVAARKPGSAEKRALAVQVEGVNQGKPFGVLRSDVATARATVDHRKAEGTARLARAAVHVPGLPLLSLVEVEEVTSRAVCEVGREPVAESNLLGSVRVFGRKTKLTTDGPTRVEVPGVGEVTLDLSKAHTTSRTAAATALELTVSVDPLRLNVAEVRGTLTLAEATCRTPGFRQSAPRTAPDVEPQTGAGPGAAQPPAADHLAATGGGTLSPYLSGGAVVLLAAGAGSVVLARSRGRS